MTKEFLALTIQLDFWTILEVICALMLSGWIYINWRRSETIELGRSDETIGDQNKHEGPDARSRGEIAKCYAPDWCDVRRTEAKMNTYQWKFLARGDEAEGQTPRRGEVVRWCEVREGSGRTSR